MAEGIHELAPHHLPGFITAPGETDTLFVIIVISVLLIVVMIGNLYFKLHALPEKMAHDANSTQLQLVGVLALLALFTHNNIFWIGALLLAAVRLPDFSTPLTAIADRLGDISAMLRPADRPEETMAARAPDRQPSRPLDPPDGLATELAEGPPSQADANDPAAPNDGPKNG